MVRHHERLGRVAAFEAGSAREHDGAHLFRVVGIIAVVTRIDDVPNGFRLSLLRKLLNNRKQMISMSRHDDGSDLIEGLA